jgi:hypothetical protein
MKKILLLSSLLFILCTVSAQQSDQDGFEGKWLVQLGGDSNISLNFSDSNKIYFSLGSKDEWNGKYNYKIGKSNATFILSLRSANSARKDYFEILLIGINGKEYKLTEIMHFYDDGRPPESELLENTLYILKKVKNN